MHNLRRLFSVAMATIMLWSWTAAIVLAQKPPEYGPDGKLIEPEEKSYAVGYMVIMLVLGMSLAMVCRSGNRSNDPKRGGGDEEG